MTKTTGCRGSPSGVYEHMVSPPPKGLWRVLEGEVSRRSVRSARTEEFNRPIPEGETKKLKGDLETKSINKF